MISSNDFNAIAAMDLEPIKMKLMHKPSGEGWSAEKANAVEIEYRRFLYLMKTFPNEQTAPLVDVDTFWHYHILDTMKYALDCEQAFGYFLHHYPYVGLLGEDSEQERQEGGDRMQKLYEQTFGDSYDQAAIAIARAESNPPVDAAAGAETAYCTLGSKQASYCTLGSTQAAYCTLGNKQVAYCTFGNKQAAYCTLGNKQAAYCTLGNKQATADCTFGHKHAAYCTFGSKKPADCGAANDAPYCTFRFDRSSHSLHQAA